MEKYKKRFVLVCNFINETPGGAERPRTSANEEEAKSAGARAVVNAYALT